VIPTVEDLSEKTMVPGRIVAPGDSLFVFSGSFYVEAQVIEVSYIWSDGKKDKPGLWHSSLLSGKDDISTATEEKGPGGWPINRKVPLEELEQLRSEEGFKVVNQMPWVDWPIGHAAYIGDDGFFTLEEARARYGRFSARKKHRRARNYLSRVHRFVASTWTANGETHPGFPPRESFYRRIYV
jgi:hypothetical protein